VYRGISVQGITGFNTSVSQNTLTLADDGSDQALASNCLTVQAPAHSADQFKFLPTALPAVAR